MEPKDVVAVLSAVGLGSVPTWCKPANVLSNGERYRANVARMLTDSKAATDHICLDEFTSEVNRETAKSLSTSLSKYLRRNNLKAVIASCHKDIINWLEPDWVFSCDESLTKFNEAKPNLKKVAKIEIY